MSKVSEWTCDKCSKTWHNCIAPVEHKCRPMKVRIGATADHEPTIEGKLITTEMCIQHAKEVCDVIESDSIIVGVARSGMLPATVIATHLHCPLYVLDHVQGTLNNVGTGRRATGMGQDCKNIYIVDDSVWSGDASNRAYKFISEAFPGKNVRHVALYGNPATKTPEWSYVHNMVPVHFFEWNYMNTFFSGGQAYDMDGVLCRDFTTEEDDDGPLYIKTIENMKPCSNRPLRGPITIITARLEKYRPQTEAWLKRHGFEVEKLIMGPWATKEERAKHCMGTWKAGELLQNCPGKNTFVESCKVQADVMRKKLPENYTVVSVGSAEVFTGEMKPVSPSDDADKIINELKSQGITRENSDQIEGLGDLVHATLNKLGITEERFKAALGLQECKCKERRKFLNKLMPFGRK